jgi:hypothetical protein
LFAELFFSCQGLEVDYNSTTVVDVEMMNQIIYNTKPTAYQKQLTVIKDQLIKEAARYLRTTLMLVK